jgi:hypothetical protein
MKTNLRDTGRHEVGAFPNRCRGSFAGRLGAEWVHVVYSDESGMGDESDEPIVVVTAIMLNMDSQWAPTSMALSAVVHHIPKGLLVRKTGRLPELKGTRLFGCESAWGHTPNRRPRLTPLEIT